MSKPNGTKPTEPLFVRQPSQRLRDLVEGKEVPTYQEIGLLWNTYRNEQEAPTLKGFGHWLVSDDNGLT